MKSSAHQRALTHPFLCAAAVLGAAAGASTVKAQSIPSVIGYREWIARGWDDNRADANNPPDVPADKTLRSAHIMGQDERVRIDDTTAYPWCTIGLILSEVETAEGTAIYAGTGTLIGTKTVLTCAHNIVDDDEEWVDNVTFIPGKNRDNEPYGRIRAVKLCVPENYWQNQEDYDIAMMILETPIGDTTGYMTVKVEPREFFQADVKLNTAGYPGDLDGCQSLYRAYGYATGMLLDLIQHDMDSSYGQSGSPVWTYDASNEVRELVAVHVIGGTDYNIAVRVSDELFDWINDYLKENDTISYTVPADPTPDTVAAPAPALCGLGAVGSLGIAALTLLGCTWAGRAGRAGNHPSTGL
jgi:V8-like Glu-specific endopeptidase